MHAAFRIRCDINIALTKSPQRHSVVHRVEHDNIELKKTNYKLHSAATGFGLR